MRILFMMIFSPKKPKTLYSGHFFQEPLVSPIERFHYIRWNFCVDHQIGYSDKQNATYWYLNVNFEYNLSVPLDSWLFEKSCFVLGTVIMFLVNLIFALLSYSLYIYLFIAIIKYFKELYSLRYWYIDITDTYVWIFYW